jgi:glutamate racemase
VTSLGHRPHIAAFDSGVGGWTICRSLFARWPSADFSYICDNGFFPYGTKTDEELRQRIDQVTKDVIAPLGADLLVVACGTASTLALDLIRAQIKVPVVGVVPAIKPAAVLSAHKTIGLLATRGTVNRLYTDALIREFAVDCEVIRVGSDVLVRLAEAKLRGKAVDRQALAEEIRPLFVERSARRTDVIVLGCTHFPLLQEELEAVAPWPVTWLEPAEAIARRADFLLAGMLPPAITVAGKRQWIFTAANDNARELEAHLHSLGFTVRYQS